MSFASPHREDRFTSQPSGPSARPESAAPQPVLRLYNDTLLMDVSDGWTPKYREVQAAVLSLCFDYEGTLVASTDPTSCVLGRTVSGSKRIHRQPEAEGRARYLLESFGAVELRFLDDYAVAPDSQADYLVHVDGNVNVVCSFAAYVLPQLRALGWRVCVDDDYKWKVVDATAPWYAELSPATSGEREQSDWFSLELGVRVEETNVNLLPILLDYLEKSQAVSLDGLMGGFGRSVAIPLKDGRYVTVPRERFRLVMQVLSEMYREGGGRERVEFPEVQALALGNLGQAFDDEEPGSLCWSGETAIRDKGEALLRGQMANAVPTPTGLQATLRPYQTHGLAFLQHLRENQVGGILADDMGLGKTLQTISHLLTEKVSGRMRGPSLVVAPTSLVGNWRREIAKFAPDLSTLVVHGPRRHRVFQDIAKADVVITTYPCLTRDIEELEEIQFHALVLDEAHTIKNSRSQAHRAVKRLKAKHPLCLTGTPVENNLEELWALFDFLMPGLLGDLSRFRSSFRYPIERDQKMDRLTSLRDMVRPYILRRYKEDVAPELPPKTEIVRPVELLGAQLDLYEGIRVAAHARVRQVIRQKGIAGSTIAILDALMKLRQVCCDPRLVNVQSAEGVTESAKYQLLFDLVPTLLDQGRRILIFSQFTSMLELLGLGLEERSIRYEILTGATRDRQKQIDAFENGRSDVFLLSLKAAGTGLNLTSADTVIHYDPWWNPTAQAQATDRAYRIGQTNPVFVYNLIVAGSVEEQMLKLQRRKRCLADSILEEGGAAGLDWSVDDVDGLFAPIG